jgi:hypothetical protein
MRSISIRTRVLAITGVASVLSLGLSAVASAEVVERHVYAGTYPTKSFDGSDAVGAGPFGEPNNIAINQANGDVYVGGSSGYVYHLNAQGVSQPFSAIAPNTVISQPTYGLGSLKVDNSGTSTQGRIYAKTESPILEAWLPSGAPITTGFPIENLGDGCGMDVAPDGGIWVTNYGDGTHRYGSDGSNSNEMIAFGGMCGFAIDSHENFYIPGYGGQTIKKYSRSGTLLDEDWGGENQGSENLAIDRSDDTVYAARGNSVNVFDSTGKLIDTFGLPEAPKSYPGLGNAEGIAINETTGEVYVGNGATGEVDRFVETGPITIPDVTTEPATVTPTTATLKAVINPDAANGGTPITNCTFEWGSSTEYNHSVPCDQATPIAGQTSVTATITGLTPAAIYHFRIVASSANAVGSKGDDRSFQPSGPPELSNVATSEVFSDGARMNSDIDPAGSTTTFKFEWGTAPCSANPCTSVTTPEGALKTPVGAESVFYVLTGLTPGTTYYWRVVAVNNNSTVSSPDQEFVTFPLDPPTVDSCPNALVRKQTGSSLVPDCRAYELVSVTDSGGYDVESNLVSGQHPLAGYPEASNPPRVLYTVHYGAIPGIGDPPNFGNDPYVATRGEDGWTTEYVGVPVSSAPDPSAFGSPLTGADAGLGTMAFGGPNICEPCLPDGTTGVPIRTASGQLEQGMKGSITVADPAPAGEVRKQFSADGSHFVFGSEQKFEPAGNVGSVSIYDRNLSGGGTQVVSTMPDGTTMSGKVAELDISANGSRILVGKLVGTDAAGNDHYDLYMHVGGSADSVVVADTPGGVIYDGMTGDGTKVFFTTADPIGSDSDTSTDVFRADVGTSSATVTRVSAGTGGSGDTDACTPTGNWNSIEGATDCGALGLAGGGGVATGDGTVYFLSPELLAGAAAGGTAGEPNLFSEVPGGSPKFVATLAVTDPLVVHAADDAALRSTEDIQVTRSGEFAAFGSRQPITGYPTNGHLAVYRYDEPNGVVACASCASTRARSDSDAVLPHNGGGLSEDGRVFFTTADPLNLRDLNGDKTDAYEWKGSGPRLISTGTSQFDSALLSASNDGKDVLFFTHDVLAPQDHNGNLVKIYDAREGGGFYVQLNEPPCRASDECHGPGTQAPPPPDIGTYRGDGGQAETESTTKKPRCHGNRVRRHGTCVKPRGHKRHQQRHRHG